MSLLADLESSLHEKLVTADAALKDRVNAVLAEAHMLELDAMSAVKAHKWYFVAGVVAGCILWHFM